MLFMEWVLEIVFHFVDFHKVELKILYFVECHFHTCHIMSNPNFILATYCRISIFELSHIVKFITVLFCRYNPTLSNDFKSIVNRNVFKNTLKTILINKYPSLMRMSRRLYLVNSRYTLKYPLFYVFCWKLDNVY